MAISARTASLQAQRQSLSSTNWGGRRLLAPTNNAVNSIAAKSAKSELSVMVQRYNDGIISNSEMQDFLNRQLVNPGLSAADKEDIQNQIRDFDLRIRKDKLESVFRLAPENSMEKIAAAQALANFYKDRAASLAPDSPAQSQAYENQGLWDQKVKDIQDTVELTARKNMRYLKEQKINQLAGNSSDRAYARAQMYADLAQQAQTDGDAIEANRLMALAQGEQTNGDALVQREYERADKEQKAAERETILDYFGQLENAYHDGKIDEASYLDYLSQISARVDATNDYGLINRLNRTTDTIQKNLSKGGLRRGSTASGLPVVLGKGPMGAATTDKDMEDFNYQDSLRVNQEAFKRGEISAEQYAQNIFDAVSNRQEVLDQRYESLYELAKENPNTKVVYEGRKQRVVDVLDAIQKEQEAVAGQVGLISTGNAAVAIIPPNMVSTSGSILKNGKPYATFQLVDANELASSKEWVESEDGTWNKIEYANKVPISFEEYSMNQAQDPSRYSQDKKTGQYYRLEGDPTVGVYEPGGNRKIEVPYVPGQKTQKFDASAFEDYAKHDYVSGEAAQAMQNRAKTIQAEQERKRKESQVPDAVMAIRKATDAILPNKIISPVPTQVKPVGEQIQERIIEPAQENLAQAGEVIQKNVVQPVTQFVNKAAPTVQKVAQAATNMNPIQQGTRAVANTVSKTVAPVVQKAIPAIQQSAQKVASTPLSQPVQKAVNSGVVGKVLQTTLGAQQATQNALKNIGTTISGGVDWLKKKFGW